MHITLFGAAGEVTGSAYLLTTAQARLLIDFGMFQGRSDDERRNRVPRTLDPRRLDAVVITHAHLDHVGRLPLLTRYGYRGPIFATAATIELAELLLEDGARLQEEDTRRLNQKRMRAGQKLLQPLYDDDDVQTALRQMQPLPYGEAVNVAPSVDVTAYESGHVLGSVSLALRVHENGAIRDIVFSGDIGPCGMPILRDPEPPPHADLVFLESTYGDRDHRPLAETIAEFKTILRTAYADQGKILVPAFAVGRSQQILYHLAEFFREGVVPPFPIYLDSPMAIKATALYSKFPGLADEEASELNRSGRLRRDLATLHNTLSSQDSRAINDVDGPCLIIAGSGMATGGRILHHLKHNLWKPETDVVIVGYQGVGTLGRQLVEGAQRVRIFGEPIAVRAAIHTLGGFSAHAGQSELLDWLAPMASTRPRVVLTHGEDAPRAALAAKIAERYAIQALLPKLDQVIEL